MHKQELAAVSPRLARFLFLTFVFHFFSVAVLKKLQPAKVAVFDPCEESLAARPPITVFLSVCQKKKIHVRTTG